MIPRKRGADKGQALVEFALILIVLLLFIFIIIEAGRAFQSWLTLQNAARSAGRYAITGQFETDCLFVFPACLDPRVQSIKDEGRRASSGLPIDDSATIGLPQSFVTEVWSVDENGVWIPDFAGGSADPIRVRVTYYMPFVTPLFRPIAEMVRLRGQVVVVAEDYDQLGTSQVQSSAPPIGSAGDPNPTDDTYLDLELIKSASALNVQADSPLDYTLEVINHGPYDAENVTVVDTLPAGTTFLDWTVTGAGTTGGEYCEEVNLEVTCYLPNLAGDGSILNTATVTLETSSPDAQGTTITNTAEVFNGTTAIDTAPNNNKDSIAVTIGAPSADLAVTIDDSQPALINTPLTYTIWAYNNGPDDATGVAVTVTLSADLGPPTIVSGPCSISSNVLIRCNPGNLANGASQVFEFVVTPVLSGTVTAVASIAGNEFDPVSGNNSDSVVTNISDKEADAFVQKSAPPGPLPVGVDFTYTILARNNGPDTVDSLIVTDTLPDSVSLVFPLDSGCVVGGGGTVVCTTGPLDQNDFVTFTITVTPNEAEIISNQVTVGGDFSDPAIANNFDFVDTAIGAGDLEISKTGASFVLGGDVLTYTLTITNNGPGTMTGVEIVDDLPPNMSPVSVWPDTLCIEFAGQVICDGGPFISMAPDTSLTVIITGTAPADDFIVNTATVSSVELDLDESNNTAVFTSTTAHGADLEVSKFAFENAPGEGGHYANTPLQYLIQVGNNGAFSSTGSIVTDTLPVGVLFGSASPGCGNSGNIITCTVGNLDAGLTQEFSAVVTPTIPGEITNTVEIAGVEFDPIDDNNTFNVATTILPADLVIQKFAPATAFVTDTITYTIVITNNGPSPAIDVVVTDTLPMSVTFSTASSSLGSCTGGVQVFCTIGTMLRDETVLVTIAVNPFDIGVALNEVEVTAVGTDPSQISDDMDTAVTNIVPVADLAIGKTAEGPFYAGETLTYTLVVTNNGPSVATGVSITDTLPPQASYDSWSTADGSCPTVGATVICNLNDLPLDGTATVTVVVTAGLEGDYVNEAEVGGDVFDPESSNDAVTITTTVLPAADLAISKSASGSLLLGQPLTYTVQVENLGPSEALTISVEDILPAALTNVTVPAGSFSCSGAGTLTCDLASLPSGNSATVTIVGIPTITGTITNTAQVSSAITDLYGSNNVASEAVDIEPASDLSLAKSAEGSFLAGDPLTYTLVVTNAGPSPATNVTVVDNLPAGVTFDSANPGAACLEAGGVVTCTIANLAIGATQQFIIAVDVPSSLSDGTVLQNDASASATEGDPVPGDNFASVQTTIIREADLSLEKIASQNPVTVTAGTNLTYTLLVTNSGPSDASSVVISDTLISELSFVPGGACSEVGSVVSCNISGGLAAGATDSVELIVLVAPSVPDGGSLVNTAGVSAAEGDPDPLNNQDTETTIAIRSSDLRITKNDGNDPIAASETQTYTIEVENLGPSDASSVMVTDVLTDVLIFDPVGTSIECAPPVLKTVVCDNFDVAAGGLKLLTIVAVLDSAAPEGLLNNAATVNHPNDPNSANNSDTEISTVVLKTDLTIDKNGSPDPVVAGTVLTYTIVVTNNGPSDSTGSSISDSLPAGLQNEVYCEVTSGTSCTPSTPYTGTISVDPLAAGESAAFLIRADVSLLQRNDLINTAIIDANEYDPKPWNDSSQDTTDVTAETDLGIAKSAAPDPVLAGDLLTYTLVVSNNGPFRAYAITVTDVLTDALAFSVADSSAECDVSVLDPQKVICLPASAYLDVGDTITFTVVATVSSSVVSGTYLANTASVSASELDPVPGNDSSPTINVLVADLPP